MKSGFCSWLIVCTIDCCLLRDQIMNWRLLPCLALVVACAGSPARAQSVPPSVILQVQNVPGRAVVREAYDRGYREGARRGEFDARRGVAANIERDPVYRDGMRGYNRRFGSREVYRNGFQRGYVDGYRSSFGPLRAAPGRSWPQRTGSGVFGPQPRGRGYEEPAYARGYSDGYKQGSDDGRDQDRYDPVGQRNYRDGDQGYYGSYGSRDAYRNNYRAGYREGYEAGYRFGTGRR